MNSPLVNYTKISPNSSNPRNSPIRKITVHHMAGNLTVEKVGEIFSSTSRQASSNYGIDSTGRVGLYVDEKNRAWTSGSPSNDNQAVTIEVANVGGAPNWEVGEVAFSKLVELCADICRRNGIPRLIYDGTVNGNLTRHNMFQATTCPGANLQNRFPELANKVNAILGNPAPAPKPTQQGSRAYRAKLLGGTYLETVYKADDTANGYAGIFGKPIDGIQIWNARYRVHVIGKGWLPWVNKVDDTNEGYAGWYGFAIDGIQVEGCTYQAHTRESKWLPKVSKADDTADGYAGIFGQAIDGFRIF